MEASPPVSESRINRPEAYQMGTAGLRRPVDQRDGRFPAKWVIDGSGLRFIERRASMLWGL